MSCIIPCIIYYWLLNVNGLMGAHLHLILRVVAIWALVIPKCGQIPWKTSTQSSMKTVFHLSSDLLPHFSLTKFIFLKGFWGQWVQIWALFWAQTIPTQTLTDSLCVFPHSPQPTQANSKLDCGPMVARLSKTSQDVQNIFSDFLFPIWANTVYHVISEFYSELLE